MTKANRPTLVQTTDPANGGYYTVQDLRPGKQWGGSNHDFNVRGYDWHGTLLLHTWHVGDHSLQMEVDAWERRGAGRRLFDPSRELK